MVANTTDFDHLVSPTTTSLVFNGSNPRITEETEAKNDFISISCIWKICVSWISALWSSSIYSGAWYLSSWKYQRDDLVFFSLPSLIRSGS